MRGDHLSRMAALEIGESLVLHPDDGDTVDALYARIKQAARRGKTPQLAFRVSKRGETVTVARCAPGQSRKLSWLLNMRVGDTVFYSDHWDEATCRLLRRKFDYWTFALGMYCRAERHEDGNIYLRCIYNRNRIDEVDWHKLLRSRRELDPIAPQDRVCAPFG